MDRTVLAHAPDSRWCDQAARLRCVASGACGPEHAVDRVLQQLLVSRDRTRVEILRRRRVREALEVAPAGHDRAAQRLVPSGVAGVATTVELTVGDQGLGNQQGL